MLQKSIPHHLATYQVFASTCSLALRVRSPMVVRSSDFSRIMVAAVSRSAKHDARSIPARGNSPCKIYHFCQMPRTAFSLWFAMCLTGKPWFYLRWTDWHVKKPKIIKKTHHSIPVRQALPQLTSAVMAPVWHGQVAVAPIDIVVAFLEVLFIPDIPACLRWWEYVRCSWLPSWDFHASSPSSSSARWHGTRREFESSKELVGVVQTFLEYVHFKPSMAKLCKKKLLPVGVGS